MRETLAETFMIFVIIAAILGGMFLGANYLLSKEHARKLELIQAKDMACKCCRSSAEFKGHKWIGLESAN